jgi:hypothetical protein
MAGVESYRENFWKRMAFTCRYGHMSLHDAMEIPNSDSHYFLRELGKLISEENKVPGATD